MRAEDGGQVDIERIGGSESGMRSPTSYTRRRARDGTLVNGQPTLYIKSTLTPWQARKHFPAPPWCILLLLMLCQTAFTGQVCERSRRENATSSERFDERVLSENQQI